MCTPSSDEVCDISVSRPKHYADGLFISESNTRGCAAWVVRYRRVENAMTISDLLLVATALATVVALLLGASYLARRRWRPLRHVLLGLGILLGSYAAVLVTVSLTSPRQVLGPHQVRCFDDWCLSVQRVARQHTVGRAPHLVTARGQFYLVTVVVSSQAQRISQRAVDAQVYLADANGQRYDPAPDAQHALDAAGVGGQPLDTDLPPGGSFTRTVVFDVPIAGRPLGLVVVHGLFPAVLVIGDPQGFLHKPTLLTLDTGADR